jgi:prepilin-type N-terminal cleavage/methylation domain-containing protein
MARPTPDINPAVLLRRQLPGRRGFTLAECLIASVVLAVTVLGICGALTAAAHQTEAMEVDARAVSIAREMMEQIAARPFDPPASGDQPGWLSGNHSTNTFDNIADYNGLTQDSTAPVDATHLADAITYQTGIAVEFRSSPSGPVAPGGDFALITVSVTPSSHGDPVLLQRLAARYTLVR